MSNQPEAYPRQETTVPPVPERLEVTVPDVALIIEGGGMRASYTAGAIITLLQHELFFGKVYGISAGSSHSVNYLSRDIARTKASFVDLVDDPQFGGVGSLLAGRGYFNAPHLYEGLIEDCAGSDDVMAFDWETFQANPADLHIEAIDWDTGETVAWTKADMPTPRAMGLRVRASSTMPVFMPPTEIDGRTYMDGGMGTSWGICLNAARKDGFQKFFIVRTRPRGYRRKPLGKATSFALKSMFRAHPVIAQRTIERWQPYNELCDEIERLEASGAAYVFYPEAMEVSNKETDRAKLEASFLRGLAQAQREVEMWEGFLR
ncbi:MAG TPA: patatin family protein [Candidatus Aphodovivens excrementavium]|nr:patatin family protein [Candidatus Aphodovivens excrementavium]